MWRSCGGLFVHVFAVSQCNERLRYTPVIQGCPCRRARPARWRQDLPSGVPLWLPSSVSRACERWQQCAGGCYQGSRGHRPRRHHAGRAKAVRRVAVCKDANTLPKKGGPFFDLPAPPRERSFFLRIFMTGFVTVKRCEFWFLRLWEESQLKQPEEWYVVKQRTTAQSCTVASGVCSGDGPKEI